MREIMREFSGIALAAISFFLCMVVLSNIRMSDGTTGVFNIIGKRLQTEDIKADSAGMEPRSYERIWEASKVGYRLREKYP